MLSRVARLGDARRRLLHAAAPYLQESGASVAPPKQAPLPADVEAPVAPAAPPPATPPPLPRFVARPDAAPLPLRDAVAAVLALRRARFEESVELCVRLGIDPKRSDQMVRGVAALPHGTGKRVRIAVFATGSAAEEARGAGADLVGSDDLVARIKAGGAAAIDFDKVIATPACMAMLSGIARVLGPRGLMPNPKVGSLTNDVTGAVEALRRGQVQFRADRYATVHVPVGKVDFSGAALEENVAALLQALAAARPTGKGTKSGCGPGGFFRSVQLATTMGKGSIDVSLPSVSAVSGGAGRPVMKS